jgi:hypothetical protein
VSRFERHLQPKAAAPSRGHSQVLDYFGRYTHRVAISNNRLVSMDNSKVSFRWKDYRDDYRQKTMALDGEEFVRRFLVHVLPDGFHRIRHYGFLANCHRKRKLALCRELLGMAPSDPAAEPPANYRDRFEALTGHSLRECPHCHTDTMVVIGCIARPTVCQSCATKFCGALPAEASKRSRFILAISSFRWATIASAPAARASNSHRAVRSASSAAFSALMSSGSVCNAVFTSESEHIRPWSCTQNLHKTKTRCWKAPKVRMHG